MPIKYPPGYLPIAAIAERIINVALWLIPIVLLLTTCQMCLSCARGQATPVVDALPPVPAAPTGADGLFDRIVDDNGNLLIRFDAPPRGVEIGSTEGFVFRHDYTVPERDINVSQFGRVASLEVQLAANRIGVAPWVLAVTLTGWTVYLVDKPFKCGIDDSGLLCLGLTHWQGDTRFIVLVNSPCVAATSWAHELAHVMHPVIDNEGDPRHEDPRFFGPAPSIVGTTNQLATFYCQACSP